MRVLVLSSEHALADGSARRRPHQPFMDPVGKRGVVVSRTREVTHRGMEVEGVTVGQNRKVINTDL